MSARYEVFLEANYKIVTFADSAAEALDQAKESVPDIEWSSIKIERSDDRW